MGKTQLEGRWTGRTFVKRAALAGGGVAGLGLFGLTGTAAAATDADVVNFGNAAVERIAVAFYSNALGESSPYGVPGDVAKGTLFNSAIGTTSRRPATRRDRTWPCWRASG